MDALPADCRPTARPETPDGVCCCLTKQLFRSSERDNPVRISWQNHLNVHRFFTLRWLPNSSASCRVLQNHPATAAPQAAADEARGRTLRFLANVDPVDVARALNGLDPATTMAVVVSKTFTTAETMLNARTVRC